MTDHVASCLCEQLRVTIRGEPDFCTICHCSKCRKRSGSAFGVNAYYSREKVVSIAGSSSQYRRQGDSGRYATRHFCPTCGIAVYAEVELFPQGIAVFPGTFAGPYFPQPTLSVWTEGKCDWVQLPKDLPVFAKGRGSAPAKA